MILFTEKNSCQPKIVFNNLIRFRFMFCIFFDWELFGEEQNNIKFLVYYSQFHFETKNTNAVVCSYFLQHSSIVIDVIYPHDDCPRKSFVKEISS